MYHFALKHLCKKKEMFYNDNRVLLIRKEEKQVPQETNQIVKDNLMPNFLFTWKGIRTEDEKKYHSHDYIELAIILAGKGKYKIDDVIYEVEEGDVLVLNPGVMHQPIFQFPTKPTVEFFIGFSQINFEGMEPNHFTLGNGSPVYHTSPDLRLKLFRICDSMGIEKEVYRPGRYYMLRSYLEQILILLVRDEYKADAKQTAYPFESVNKKYVVEQIIHYFEEHYNEKISLDRIAGNMYLSPFYISKLFKSETGMTPIRHLIDIRLERAKVILEEDRDISIQEAAISVGYDDVFYFSKLFKKKYGCAPSSIRKA